MDSEQFRKYGREIIDFIADYLETNEKYPVRSQVSPGDIIRQLPDSPPLEPENFDSVLNDFKEIIMPGLTHWQSPNFYAYFSSNNSYESILGELLSSGIGINAFSWETSPAATELEEQMIIWLRDLIHLPECFTGVIQDTASTATLCSILTAREQKINNNLTISRNDIPKMRVYCSIEAHSSIERAVHISGIGAGNLVKINTLDNFSMDTDELILQIEKDISEGFIPFCVVSAIGTTGCLAVDSVDKISEIAKKYNLWHHIDAAYSGNAMILDEYRYLSEMSKDCDTFVFNPHKWLFVNFDFSAYFVRDKNALISTFEILPEYLKTSQSSPVNNYRDWGIQLGRRFRALKAWFVLRGFGVRGLQDNLRNHIKIAQKVYDKIKENDDFEILAPFFMNLLCFRYNPKNNLSESELNELNEKIYTEINSTGKIYLTKTKLKGKTAIRMVTGTTRVNEVMAMNAIELIMEIAGKYK